VSAYRNRDETRFRRLLPRLDSADRVYRPWRVREKMLFVRSIHLASLLPAAETLAPSENEFLDD
jgi:hypothetical protein